MTDTKLIFQENSSISLPVNNEDLGNFLSGLLGQAQSIERDFDQAFDIDHAWLINLHEVIDQRVNQQAIAQLLNFKAVVNFEKRMKRTLTSIESFYTYKEMKQLRSIGVKLEWSYLIQFPNSTVPEKQEITFFAKTNSTSKSDSKLDNFLYSSSKVNVINIRINYTERTWGNDMENLLEETIITAARNELKNSRYHWMQFGLFFVILASCVFIANRIYEYQYQSWYQLAGKSLELLEKQSAISLETLNANFLQLGKLILASPGKLSALDYYAIGTLIGLIIASFSVMLTEFTSNSFVVLNEKAEKWRGSIIMKERRNVLTIIWGYFAAVSSSLIASILYAFFSK